MVDLESSKKSIQQFDNQLKVVQDQIDEFGVSLTRFKDRDRMLIH